MNDNIFWTQDPTILYKDNNYMEFIPSQDMSRTAQLNASSRFVIYYLIIVLILKKEEQFIHLGIVAIVFIIILFYLFDSDLKGKQEELIRQKGIENFNDNDNFNKDYVNFESGYYDSNGELHMGKYYGSKNKTRTRADRINYSLNDYKKYEKEMCRKPTNENPFMNPLQTDFGIENPPTACNVDDEEISTKISTSFNDNLFRDVSDVFGRENSQRQFYTVPQMNPPDTHTFAMWLYGNQNICKNDQSKCMNYTDLRYNGGSVGGY